MSLANATLLRIDPPDVRGGGGDPIAATPGPALSVRCILSEPTKVVQWLIDDLELSSTAVLFVRHSDFPAAGEQLVKLAHVSVRLDGDGAGQRLLIEHATRRVFGGLSHVQALLREV